MKNIKIQIENKAIKNSFSSAAKILCYYNVIKGPKGFLKAGAAYPDPWTRDGSVNTWKAGNLFIPQIARQTLNLLTQEEKNKIYIRFSNLYGYEENRQWWDLMLWTLSAWNSYLISGDNSFLLKAFITSLNTFKKFKEKHFNKELNLFEGAAFFQDGISGYPDSFYDPNRHSSFVYDHPNTTKIMCLSTNAIYYGALLALIKMQKVLIAKNYLPNIKVNDFKLEARKLKAAINRNFWIGGIDNYGYLIHGTGPFKGKLEKFQEGAGLAFCIEFGIPNQEQMVNIMATYQKYQYGIVAVTPAFKRFKSGVHGRHNMMIWPQVNGLWATACIKKGFTTPFDWEFLALTKLFQNADGDIRELYQPELGKPHGGKQDGDDNWASRHHQTWGAVGYLSLFIEGIFGMRFQEKGLYFEPYMPKYIGKEIIISNFKYMNNELKIRLVNNGSKIKNMYVNGKFTKEHFIPRFVDKNIEILIEMY